MTEFEVMSCPQQVRTENDGARTWQVERVVLNGANRKRKRGKDMKAMKKALALGLALAMVVTAVPVTNAQAASTGLPKSKNYYAGKTYTLKLTTPSSWKSVKTTWSEKSSKVSLSSKKAKSVKVKAIKKGSATVKATVTYKKSSKSYKKTYSCKVTVKNSSINAPKTATVEARDTVALKVTGRPSTAKITYESDNTAVATVDAKGVVTGVAEGTATITSAFTCGTVKRSAKTTVTVTPSVAKVTGAVATNATTITLSGKNLDKLSMNDVKVGGYSVKDYVASADFSTATVTLTSALTPNKETKITVTAVGFEGTVTYQVAAEAIAVKEATYKAAAKNDQYLTLLVNGAETTLAEMKANGYAVTFYAYKYVNGTLVSAPAFFNTAGGSNSSTDGTIKGSNTAREAGDYQVKVEAKSSTGKPDLISKYATIVLSNNNEVASAINSISIADVKGKFVQNVDSSLKLVQDEVVSANAISIKTNYNDYAGGAITAAAIKSDNSASVTVKYDDTVGKEAWIITAHKAGTANLTVTYGTLTKVIPVTVDTTPRLFSSVVVGAEWEAPTSVLIDTYKRANVYAVDNHGANMIGQDIYTEWSAHNNAIAGVVTIGAVTLGGIGSSAVKATDSTGKITLEYVTGSTAGAQATFDFYKGNGATYTGAKLAQYTVKTVATENTTYAFKPVQQSAQNFGVTKDGNLDLNFVEGKRIVELQLKTYHQGIEQGVTTSASVGGLGTDYKLEYDPNKIAVIDVNGNLATAISNVKAALKAGTPLEDVDDYLTPNSTYAGDVLVVAKGNTTSTVLKVKKAGEIEKAAYTINVANTVPTLTDINLATNQLTFNINTTVDYKNLLNITTTEKNPQIKGVVLGNNTNNYGEVRLCTDATGLTDIYGNSLSQGDLYVVTGNGKLVLGQLMIKQTDVSATGSNIVTGISVPGNTKTTIEIYLAPAKTSPYYRTNQYIASHVAVNN